MKKILIPAILFLGISILSDAQTGTNSSSSNENEKSSREKKGDKEYFVNSYDKSIETYSREKHLTVDGQRKLAKSYFKINRIPEAETAYAKLITLPGGNTAEDYFNYAMVLKANSKYEEAHAKMDKFVELAPNDLRGKDHTANKGRLASFQSDNGKYKISSLSLNTAAIDFGTAFYKNSIIFASSRTTKVNPSRSKRTGQPYLNMYVAEIDKDQLKTPENFDKELNEKMNDGPASFNKEGTFMAFTKNNYNLTKKQLIVNLEIYFRTYSDGKWSEPTPFALNSTDFSVGHPSLSADGNTMYFSSNRPGGFGGVDLYRTKKESDNTWGKAENLGSKINTESDEMFPFYEEVNGTLFFTSNGRYGLGGMDVFRSEIKGPEFGEAVNIGAPINGPHDDFAAIIDAKMERGYFSSNRTGGKGLDDIYAFEITTAKKTLSGFAKNSKSQIIPNTFITVLDLQGNTLDTLTTKSDGAFSFQVETNKEFKISGEKKNYTKGENSANTKGTADIVTVDVTLLDKEEEVAGKIVPGADLAKVIELKTIYFDVDKSNIRKDAEEELNKIVKLMNKYPKMIVELRSHTDCRETQTYNQLLSDRRASVTTEFIKKRISNPSRITGKGFSESKLINACSCDGEVVSTCSDEEHQKNRRTEFIIK